MLFSRNFG